MGLFSRFIFGFLGYRVFWGWFYFVCSCFSWVGGFFYLMGVFLWVCYGFVIDNDRVLVVLGGELGLFDLEGC